MRVESAAAKVRRKGLHATDPQPQKDQDGETETSVGAWRQLGNPV